MGKVFVCVYLCDALVREYNRSALVIEGFSSFGMLCIKGSYYYDGEEFEDSERSFLNCTPVK